MHIVYPFVGHFAILQQETLLVLVFIFFFLFIFYFIVHPVTYVTPDT